MANLADRKVQMERAQAWSMDIMVAIVVFLGVIFVFYSIISDKQESKAKDLQDDVSKVLKNLNITQNISQIDELLNEDYQQLKRKIRVKNEFCIFFEDENGNIIYVNPNDPTQVGIGSEKINISDVPCG